MSTKESHRMLQDRAIQALIENPTIKAAAEAVGMNEVTIHRYLKQPSFQQRYKQARGRLMKSTIQRLQAASHRAIDELLRIIASEEGKDTAKVTACRTILEMAFRGMEITKLDEIEKRLAVLEGRDALHEAV